MANAPLEPGPAPMSRRSAPLTTLAADGSAPAAEPDPRRGSPRRFRMKKSINLWAFPYPGRMSLRESIRLAKEAGFDGIELNYDLESDLSPKASTREFQQIRSAADRIGIAISGLCSFLFWPYPLSSNAAAKRSERGCVFEKRKPPVSVISAA